MERNIQGLRAIAAYMVVIHHILDTFSHNLGFSHSIYNMRVGATGVDIFFVISGYIMMLTTSGKSVTPIKFMYNRIARIVPLYWFLTAVALGLIFAGFKMFGQNPVNGTRIVTTFMFLPYFTKAGNVVDPILFPGWTLNYEMMFYVVFAICLLIRNINARVIVVSFVIFSAWTMQLISDDPVVKYIGADVIIGFAAGVILWKITRIRIVSPPIAIIICALGICALGMLDYPAASNVSHARLFVIAGAFMIVLGAVSLERYGIKIRDGFLMSQGNASYSLYLVHPFILQFIAKIAKILHLGSSNFLSISLAVIMLIICGLVATFIHNKLEVPLSDKLRRSH